MGSPNAVMDNVEIWDGSSWTETTDLNTGRKTRPGTMGANNSDSYIASGSLQPGMTANTEYWDGSSWTELNNVTTARSKLGSAGSSKLGFIASGEPATTATEEWNFTNTLAAGAWASGGNMNTGREYPAGAGTQTAALAAGGNNGGSPNETALVEQYDGSSWT